MPTYKLTYHNLRGIAEPIRFIFHYCNVEFEDIRLDGGEWVAMKERFPWELLPVLEEDGKELGQSFSIGRYLGKKFKINGKDEYESAKCDEFGDALKDLLNECKSLFFETNETKKAEIRDEIIHERVPIFFGQFEKDLANSEAHFLVGNSRTWVDFYLAYYIDFLEAKMEENLLDKYPNLKSFKHNIYNLPRIKDWIERRPNTAW